MRSKRVLNCWDGALRTTCTPAALADCRNRARTVTAEKSKPETAAKSSIRQVGRESLLRDFLR